MAFGSFFGFGNSTSGGGGGTSTPDISYYRNVGTANYGQRYYAGGVGYLQTSSFTSSPVGADSFWAIPFIVSQNFTVSTMFVNATSGSGGQNFRLGIYNNTSSSVLYPSTRVYDTGTLTTVVGSSNIMKTGVNTQLTTNLYWLVFLSQNSSYAITSFTSSSAYTILGYDAMFGGGTALALPYSYGALPINFPVGGNMVSMNFYGIFVGA